jgi:hypothetical protein
MKESIQIIIMSSRIKELMELCMQEKASEVERNELLSLLQVAENEEEAKKMINAALQGATQGNGGDMSESVSAAVLEAIFQADASQQGVADGPWADVDGRQGEINAVKARGSIFRWMPYAAAAVVLFVAGVILFSKRGAQPVVITAPQPAPVKDLPPGGNKAILTLADGAVINLDDAKNGDIARDGNARIVKPGNNGELVYHAMPGNQQAIVYNTVTTPRGGQYQLGLSDGSKVWLNASSSIHFPTTFNGKERTVELTGEGYFEIARNTAMPFSVTVNGIRVHVLGTHFNINAYPDEPVVRTTLTEGALTVVAAEQTVLLRPGQQAVAGAERGMVTGGGGGRSLKLDPNADLEEVMAWKNGIFNFKNQDIEVIMRQISRWYDVEVVYEGKRPEGHFSGMISRNTSAYTVLKMLEYGGVHFRIVDGKIIIGA